MTHQFESVTRQDTRVTTKRKTVSLTRGSEIPLTHKESPCVVWTINNLRPMGGLTCWQKSSHRKNGGTCCRPICKALKHEYTPPRNNSSLARLGGFVFFLPRRQDLHASRCWRPIGQAQRHESTPSWTHSSHNFFWIFGFLDFWIFFRVGGPTPPGGRLPPCSSDFALTTAWNTVCHGRRPPNKLAKWGTRTLKNLNCYLSRTLRWVVLPSRTVSAYTHWQLLRYHMFNHAC